MPKTIIPLKVWSLLILGTFVLYLGTANAQPFMQVEADGARVTLHKDKCTLPEVTNLPNRATWEEKGKLFEGCWGGVQEMPYILAYFADKTVVAIPKQVFRRVTGV